MRKNTVLYSMLFLLLQITLVNAQRNIDSNNYCEYYNMDAHNKGSGIRTSYLTETEIIDIVYDEMIKKGFKWVSKFRIIKVDTDKYITSVCYSDKSNLGFLLENIYDLIPNQRNRNVKSLNKEKSGNDYKEKIVFLNGEYEFINIKNIPDNLHILKMDNYWYQTCNDEQINESLISKEFIIKLLKSDVEFFLESKK